jgi:hypothetical protein
MGRPRKYLTSISFAITAQDREAVERLAYQERVGIGEAARELLNAGILARRLEC